MARKTKARNRHASQCPRAAGGRRHRADVSHRSRRLFPHRLRPATARPVLCADRLRLQARITGLHQGEEHRPGRCRRRHQGGDRRTHRRCRDHARASGSCQRDHQEAFRRRDDWRDLVGVDRRARTTSSPSCLRKNHKDQLKALALASHRLGASADQRDKDLASVDRSRSWRSKSAASGPWRGRRTRSPPPARGPTKMR